MADTKNPNVKDIFTDADGQTQTITKVGKREGGGWRVEYEYAGWPLDAIVNRTKDNKLVQIDES